MARLSEYEEVSTPKYDKHMVEPKSSQSKGHQVSGSKPKHPGHEAHGLDQFTSVNAIADSGEVGRETRVDSGATDANRHVGEEDPKKSKEERKRERQERRERKARKREERARRAQKMLVEDVVPESPLETPQQNKGELHDVDMQLLQENVQQLDTNDKHNGGDREDSSGGEDIIRNTPKHSFNNRWNDVPVNGNPPSTDSKKRKSVPVSEKPPSPKPTKRRKVTTTYKSPRKSSRTRIVQAASPVAEAGNSEVEEPEVDKAQIQESEVEEIEPTEDELEEAIAVQHVSENSKQKKITSTVRPSRFLQPTRASPKKVPMSTVTITYSDIENDEVLDEESVSDCSDYTPLNTISTPSKTKKPKRSTGDYRRRASDSSVHEEKCRVVVRNFLENGLDNGKTLTEQWSELTARLDHSANVHGNSVRGLTIYSVVAEDRIKIHKYIQDWALQRGKSIRAFLDYLWNEQGRKMELWRNIYDILPQFQTKHNPLWKYTYNTYHDFVPTGEKWTAEEDKELRRIHDKMGPQWTKISKHLNRHPNDIRDRFREHSKLIDTRVTGRWSKEEIKQFDDIIHELRAELRAAGAPDGTPVSLTVISERMGGTRSREQCKTRYRNFYAEDDQGGANERKYGRTGKRKVKVEMKAGDKIWLLESIQKLENVHVTNDIPWDAVAKSDPSRPYWSPQELRSIYADLLEHIPTKKGKFSRPKEVSKQCEILLQLYEELPEIIRTQRYVPPS